ncbi:MAG TPA: tyrosine-type recombinase/integrase [Solirubrobacteraceae bacterium]|nr:tyrosine-type recombinase/integrase [Solirubrobacteraceae bacterium]
MDTTPKINVIIREHNGQPFYEAKFRHNGRQVKRRIGPAWLDHDADTGGWRPRRGRVPSGAYDERAAIVAADKLVAAYVTDAADLERVERERRTRGVTFREVARAYLRWLADVAGAKPATLRDHGYVLGEPGIRYKHGTGTTAGHVMAALGDRPATKITTREIEAVLTTVSGTGASASTVNKYRKVMCSVFSYGCKPATFALPANPAESADRRREPHPSALVFYSPAEVEAVARALAAGRHRDPSRPAVNDAERIAREAEDNQDAEMVRVAAYAGLRRGELVALRWRDVDFAGSALTIARAMSAGVESTTKSGRVRRVPLADQAAAALDRISRRDEFTSPDDFVFCNAFGRPLDGSALRRRYRRAQVAAGVRPLRFHDLRHTFGSLLAMRGVDVVTIQKAMGHSALATTSRYLHARPASEQAQVFTAAFTADVPDAETVAA